MAQPALALFTEEAKNISFPVIVGQSVEPIVHLSQYLQGTAEQCFMLSGTRNSLGFFRGHASSENLEIESL